MESAIFNEIKNLGIDALAVEARHHIHQNPDLSEHEENTRDYIAGKLTELGIPYETGVADTGLVAVITGNTEGPVIAIRADMDALPIQEENPDLACRSRKEGVMHACGHDVHTAVLLGAGAYFQSIRETLPGTVKLLFQPAEESIGGAQRMIDDGCLENPHVDAVLGLHVEPSLPVGSIGIKYGKMYACSDEVNVDIYGTSSHGARPDLGNDAIYMAATIIQNIQAIISRNIAPTDSAVCTFGTIHGGNVRNQIADHVQLTGMIRAMDETTREFLRDRITTVCDSVTSTLGGSAPVTITFKAYCTDAVVYKEWQMSTDSEFQNLELRLNTNEVEQTFDESGIYYWRFLAGNADGTCDAVSETYTVEIGESDLVCPNIFTPGTSEGANDVWKVSYKSIVEFHCSIFSRYGVKVAEFNDPNGGWDGRYGGKLVKAGVYFYVIQARGADGKNYKLSGDIKIIRFKKNLAGGSGGSGEDPNPADPVDPTAE